MPLRNDKPELWHWTQAVAWVAFDDDAAEADDICDSWYRHRSADSYEAAKKIKKAIRELCDRIVAGDVAPEWGSTTGGLAGFSRADAFGHKIEETKTTLYDIVYEGWNPPHHHKEQFNRLSFQREDIRQKWPADDTGAYPEHGSKKSGTTDSEFVPGSPSPHKKRVSQKKLNDWYPVRITECQKGGFIPTEKDDVAAARKKFKNRVTRDQVRQLRRTIAPHEWKLSKPGPKPK